MQISLRNALAAAALGIMVSAAPAFADTVTFHADLTGGAEVPPNQSTASGMAEATYDTASKMLTWNITYSGLSGDAVAAHFHGPAAAGANAPPVLPIKADKLASPISGTKALTDQQAKDLQAGMWYFNIHTAKFPNGEIRGQLTSK